jgi:hypothetical protein
MARAAALVLLLIPLAACGRPHRETWFAPNLGSPDTPELFAHPERWSKARSATTVFKFYEAELLAETPEDCPQCGPNLWPRLEAVRALPSLASWAIKVAVEVPVIKDGDCGGHAARGQALRVLGRVARGGAPLFSVAMDEPFIGGRTCGLTTDESARRTAEFVGALQASAKDLEVGDIEAFPALEPVALARWVLAVRLAGVRLAFLHLDIDRVEARRLGLDIGQQLRPVQFLCDALGIPFGVIVWGQDGSSEANYYADALGWYREMTGLFGVPDHTVFQSWATSPGGRLDVPGNLPESDPGRFTHTRLIREAVGGGPPGS